MASIPTNRKAPSMKAAFIRWAMDTPGIFNWSETVLRQEMDDIDTYIGMAYVAWKAAWRFKR